MLLFVTCSGLLAQTPTVAPNGVLNAASFSQNTPVAAGSLISIFGSSLASKLAAADSVPLSTALDDVQSVTINGIAAPLLFVSPQQVNAQVPWEVNSSTATVVVNRGGAASQPVTFSLTAAAPGIFSLNSGTGQAIAINLDGSLAAPAGSVPGIATHPAKSGDTIIVLATGLGAVTPAAKTGANSRDTLRTTTATPVVLIGGMPATVAFSGLSPDFVGVNQLNVVVPAGVATGDKVPIQIQAGGFTTTDQVTMAIGN